MCLALALPSACAGSRPRTSGAASKTIAHGKASWYGGKWHGRKTASGERMNKNALTAAHRTYPFGTKVRVTNTENNKSVVVRINDRGPWGRKSRIIDVSEAAAARLGMLRRGVITVRLEVVRFGEATSEHRKKRPTKRR